MRGNLPAKERRRKRKDPGFDVRKVVQVDGSAGKGFGVRIMKSMLIPLSTWHYHILFPPIQCSSSSNIGSFIEREYKSREALRINYGAVIFSNVTSSTAESHDQFPVFCEWIFFTKSSTSLNWVRLYSKHVI